MYSISSSMLSTPDNYLSIKDRIVEACIEFCGLDGKPFNTEGFINLPEQLMNTDALIDT